MSFELRLLGAIIDSMKKYLIIILVSLLSSLPGKPLQAELNLELPDLNLPDLGGQSNYSNVVQNRQLGLKILRRYRRSNKVIEDPEINLWIRALGNKLKSNAPRSSTPLYFVVVKDNAINAFATLGGVIVINSGLILRTKSESELAAVIAHEIAHITQNHISRMIAKANSNKFVKGAAVLAGVIASSKDPQAGQAILSATIATMAHQQLTFSRQAESEADRVGLRILARSGFNPMGMPNFLAKLEQFSDDRNANVTEYLRSHPLTLKRVTDTQIRAKKLGRFHGRENISYRYMREKVRILTYANIPIPANISARVKKYAQALRLKQQRKYQQALRLTGNSSREVSEAILIAQLLNRQRQYQQAIRILRSLINIYPDDIALSIPLAQAYISTGQVRIAWKLLNEINISEQTSLEFFDVLKETSRLARKTSQAYHAVANRNIRIGDYKSAVLQLRRAIKLPRTTENEIIQMQHQLNEIELFKQNK